MQIDCYGFEATSQWFKRRKLDPYLIKRSEGKNLPLLRQPTQPLHRAPLRDAALRRFSLRSKVPFETASECRSCFFGAFPYRPRRERKRSPVVGVRTLVRRGIPPLHPHQRNNGSEARGLRRRIRMKLVLFHQYDQLLAKIREVARCCANCQWMGQ